MSTPPAPPHVRLRIIKLVHTVVWAFFASCVVGIPVFTWAKEFKLALLLVGIVAFEVLILALNQWRCPLTPIAGRYTADRRDNFDIYLPEWLARYNKEIFGTLFGLGLLFLVVRWLT